jgi:hypothetical protein
MKHFKIHPVSDGYSIRTVGGEARVCASMTEATRFLEDAFAAEGGLIELGVGAFRLDEIWRLPPKVSLQGRGRHTLLHSGRALPALLEVVSNNGMAISSLSLQGNGTVANGIVARDCIDCDFNNLNLRDFTETGLRLTEASFMNKLSNNTTLNNGHAGTLFENCESGRGGDWVPNQVTGCSSIGERGHGFMTANSFCTNFTACSVYQSLGHGFYISAHSNSVCISGSRVFESARNGIMVEDSHEINISSNILCWNQQNGCELAYVVWGTISANNLIDNGGRVNEHAHGILLRNHSKSLQVTANAIFNWPGHVPMCCGVYEDASCSYNQISSNNINYFTEAAVRTLGVESVARDNLAKPGPYAHPSHPPSTPDPTGIVPLGPEFDRSRIEAFLQQSRRKIS